MNANLAKFKSYILGKILVTVTILLVVFGSIAA